ncbi:hypothetical protein [Geopseudomonas aromaticivorans]
MEPFSFTLSSGREIALVASEGVVYAVSGDLRFLVVRTPSGFRSEYAVMAADGRVIEVQLDGEQLAQVQAFFDAHEQTLRDQVVVLSTLNSGGVAEARSVDGRFEWFWGQEGYLRDTVEKRSIYQMHYMGNRIGESTAVPDSVAGSVRAFWQALRFVSSELEVQAAARRLAAVRDEGAESAASRLSPEERDKAARAYDNLFNEGAEGFNPYRDLD